MAVNKLVYFNEKNEDEKKLIEYIGDRNFSKYVKSLITNDMNTISQGLIDNKEEFAVLKSINTGINSIYELLANNEFTAVSKIEKEDLNEKEKKQIAAIEKFESLGRL